MLIGIGILALSATFMTFFLNRKLREHLAEEAGKMVAFLRPRWKWYLDGLLIIAVAIYAHGEYLSYVEALPDDVAAKHSIGWTFLLKNLVIVIGLLVAIIPDFKILLQRRKGNNGSKAGHPDRAEKQIQTEASGDSASLTKTTSPQDVVSQEPSCNSTETSGGSDVGDGFDRIRSKPKLRSKGEQILEKK